MKQPLKIRSIFLFTLGLIGCLSSVLPAQEILNRKKQYIIVKGKTPLKRHGLVWRTINKSRVCIGEVITITSRNRMTAAKILFEDLKIKKGDFLSLLSKADSKSHLSRHLVNLLRASADSADAGGVYVKDNIIKYIFTNDNMVVLKNGHIYKVSASNTEDIVTWRRNDRIIIIDGKEMINSNRKFIAVKIKQVE